MTTPTSAKLWVLLNLLETEDMPAVNAKFAEFGDDMTVFEIRALRGAFQLALDKPDNAELRAKYLAHKEAA
jgi:hypothetical protein